MLPKLDNLPAPPSIPARVGRTCSRFQRLEGLEVNGIMDAETWQLLSDRLGRGFTLEKASRLALNKSRGTECR